MTIRPITLLLPIVLVLAVFNLGPRRSRSEGICGRAVDVPEGKMLGKVRITVDTNVLSRDLERIQVACEGLPVEIKHTTVTSRERKTLVTDSVAIAETGVHDESLYDSGAVYADEPVKETALVGETRVDEGVVGGDDSQSRFETVLSIISSGSFPAAGRRELLTEGQRRQLRDAMIFEAHARDGRDVFISNDCTAFVGPDGGKRLKLETLFGTRIFTVDEFCEVVTTLVAN